MKSIQEIDSALRVHPPNLNLIEVLCNDDDAGKKESCDDISSSYSRDDNCCHYQGEATPLVEKTLSALVDHYRQPIHYEGLFKEKDDNFLDHRREQQTPPMIQHWRDELILTIHEKDVGSDNSINNGGRA